jgi:hypothetical protein
MGTDWHIVKVPWDLSLLFKIKKAGKRKGEKRKRERVTYSNSDRCL